MLWNESRVKRTTPAGDVAAVNRSGKKAIAIGVANCQESSNI